MHTKTPMEKLAGDIAYELFTSDEPRPLQFLLAQWRDNIVAYHPSYILAVIACYDHMLDYCHDGRYAGKIRSYREK